MGSYNWKQLPRGNLKKRLYIQSQKKIISFQKAPNFCEPKQEGCVAKQTLNDDSCLVACDGLYADITDDSLQQETIKSRCYLAVLCFSTFQIDSLGFHTLTEALTEAKYGSSYVSYTMLEADRLNLKQLFSAPTEGRDYGMGYKALSEQYKTYKENYVKYIKFDPLKPNPGKDLFLPIQWSTFVFQVCWWTSTLHWRRCSSSLTRQDLMRLNGTSRSTKEHEYWLSRACAKMTIIVH